MKRKISILIVASMLFSLFAVSPVNAETVTGKGFYNIGSIQNVTITATSSNSTVDTVLADIDGDGSFDTFYKNSDKLSVRNWLAKPEAYYGIILVEGKGVPTVDNTIYYIDQKTAESETLDFEVYPLLPEDGKKEMTLYISCSDKGEGLLSSVMGYTPGGTFNVPTPTPTPVPPADSTPTPVPPADPTPTPVPPADPTPTPTPVPPADPTPTPTPTPTPPSADTYPTGDVNNDGKHDATDALLALQIGLKIRQASEAEKLAADVDQSGQCDATDALKILQYGLKLINSWK